MKRAVLFGALVASALLATALQAQQSTNTPPAKSVWGPPNPFGPVLPAEKVAENLYLVRGGGANTAVYIWHGGVLVVDPKLADAGPGLIDAIKKVTDKPITHIVNTHAHLDHTGGNAFLPSVLPNLEIITQENTKALMEQMPQFQSAEAKKGLPNRTFKDHMVLFSGKEAVDLYYFGRGHTSGDLLVRFRAARVVATGDLYPFKGAAPFVVERDEGSALHYGETMEKAVHTIHDVDRIITGHGDMLSHHPQDNVALWQDFVDFADFNQQFVAQARASIAAGQSPEQALAEFKNKYPSYVLKLPAPPGFPVHPAGNFNIVYRELGK